MIQKIRSVTKLKLDKELVIVSEENEQFDIDIVYLMKRNLNGLFKKIYKQIKIQYCKVVVFPIIFKFIIKFDILQSTQGLIYVVNE